MLVFVYGTPTDPDRVDALLDDWSFAGDAVLEGLVRADGRYPTLVPPDDEEGSTPRVDGRLLRTAEVDALDDYEGLDRGLSVRARVPVRAHEPEAAVYLGDPARRDVDGAWPGSRSFAERVRHYLAERDVVVRPLDGR